MPGNLVVRREIAYTSGTRRRRRCLDTPRHHVGFAKGTNHLFSVLSRLRFSLRCRSTANDTTSLCVPTGPVCFATIEDSVRLLRYSRMRVGRTYGSHAYTHRHGQ